VLAGALPESLTGAGDEGAPGAEGLWWVFERLAALVEESAACAEQVAATCAALERDIAREFAQTRAELLQSRPDEVAVRATRAAAAVVARVERTARDLVASGERIVVR
jgi:hypothetical protein